MADQEVVQGERRRPYGRAAGHVCHGHQRLWGRIIQPAPIHAGTDLLFRGKGPRVAEEGCPDSGQQ